MIYEFKITLLDVDAPVWRKVHITKDASFNEFHELIQVIFDWSTHSVRHLYNFKLTDVDGEVIDKIEISNENKELLENWFKKKTNYMCYTDVHKNNCEHFIEFIQEVEPTKSTSYPICIAAENYVPQEEIPFEVSKDSLHLIEDNTLLVEAINRNIEQFLSPLLKDEQYDFDPMTNVALHPELDDETMIQELLHMFDDEDVQEGLDEMKEEKLSLERDKWEQTLQQAKVFLQSKPWEKMHEQDIFALWDPFSRRYVFCSVLGHSQESFGITAYYGIEGFLLLLESFSGEPLHLEDMQQQHSLLLTFEDRADLEKSDYDLIKVSSTRFRGKKSWPVFTSFKPGYVPWIMKEEEISLIRIIMIQTLAVIEERERGQRLPQISQGEEMLVRHIEDTTEEPYIYKSDIVHIEDLLHEDGEEHLSLSEFEIKRLSKLSETLPFTIEFSIVTLEVPVQTTEEERPFFPLLALATDAESNTIFYQDLLEHELDTYLAQKTLLDALIAINGVPESIITDQRTARLILPLLDVYDMDIQIEEKLDAIDFILEDMYDLFTDESPNI